MRHLITGGSGFIGNLAARRLRERGEDVRVLDLWDAPDRPSDIEFLSGSVTDPGCVAAAMRGIDIVHHNAALVAQTNAGQRYRDVNVGGTRIVAEAAARVHVQAFIHVSTTAVYGIPPAGPITADTPMAPIEPYGRSKLAGERIAHDICTGNGIPLITIRPRATLGAGRLGIFQILFQWIRENRAIYVIGDGHNRMQFIHAHDLMDFYMLALDRGRPGTYNVGTDVFGTLRGDLDELIGYARSTSRVRGISPVLAVNALRLLYRLGISPLVPWHYRTYHHDCYFDVEPLLALGWRPRYSNAAMLHESYDWYRANGRASFEASPHRSPLGQGMLGLVRRLS
jgi:nucleoside-diphosphate-sugar epimerase